MIGYKEYDTGRTYMAKMGDWRQNKDEEVKLDGIGGVNIVVKADVHRSGKALTGLVGGDGADQFKASISPAMHLKIKQKPRALRRWRKGQVMKLLAYQITWYGT